MRLRYGGQVQFAVKREVVHVVSEVLYVVCSFVVWSLASQQQFSHLAQLRVLLAFLFSMQCGSELSVA